MAALESGFELSKPLGVQVSFTLLSTKILGYVDWNKCKCILLKCYQNIFIKPYVYDKNCIYRRVTIKLKIFSPLSQMDNRINILAHISSFSFQPPYSRFCVIHGFQISYLYSTLGAQITFVDRFSLNIIQDYISRQIDRLIFKSLNNR